MCIRDSLRGELNDRGGDLQPADVTGAGVVHHLDGLVLGDGHRERVDTGRAGLLTLLAGNRRVIGARARGGVQGQHGAGAVGRRGGEVDLHTEGVAEVVGARGNADRALLQGDRPRLLGGQAHLGRGDLAATGVAAGVVHHLDLLVLGDGVGEGVDPGAGRGLAGLAGHLLEGAADVGVEAEDRAVAVGEPVIGPGREVGLDADRPALVVGLSLIHI